MPNEVSVSGLPVDTTGLPLVNVPIPTPNAGHTIMESDCCGRPCWIGPKQGVLVLAGAKVVCYFCIIEMMQNSDVEFISLKQSQ